MRVFMRVYFHECWRSFPSYLFTFRNMIGNYKTVNYPPSAKAGQLPPTHCLLQLIQHEVQWIAFFTNVRPRKRKKFLTRTQTQTRYRLLTRGAVSSGINLLNLQRNLLPPSSG
jgi:hypothetical protein